MNTTRTVTELPARHNGHLEQKTSPRTDRTAWIVVDSLKPTSTKPSIKCWINYRDIDHLASATWHIRLSNHLQISGHAATPTTCSGHRIVQDPLDSLSLGRVYPFDTTLTLYQSMDFIQQHDLYTNSSNTIRQIKTWHFKLTILPLTSLAKSVSHHSSPSFQNVCGIDVFISSATPCFNRLD